MPGPRYGTTYHYRGEHPLGHAARVADPAVNEHEPTEMERQFAAVGVAYDRAGLDLHPDLAVTVVGLDEERGLVLVEWTDVQGNPRTTSITPDVFAADFVEA